MSVLSQEIRMARAPASWAPWFVASLAALLACQRTPPARKVLQPSLKPAADVSHGEAPIGTTATPPPVDPRAPARSRGLHRFRLEMVHTPITIDSGVVYNAWTFNGAVPAPTLRATIGDTVDVTLINRAPMPHSIDFHAAQIAPSKYYVNVMPGDSLHFQFVPRVAGVFMYHCGTAPVAAHIANGMYGAFIVDPVAPRPQAREFVLVQSEFYTTPADSQHHPVSLDWGKLLSLSPDYVVFNGRVAEYARHPLPVPTGQLLRLYVVNAGPNRISSFHVVGAIFEHVYLDGSRTPSLSGIQTVAVPVGSGAIFEVRLHEDGTYPFVTHAFADATKGAVGMFQAGQP
jgi:nitrite reductase (NO-forming)